MSNLEIITAQLISESNDPQQLEWSTLHDNEKYKVIRALYQDDHNDLDDLAATIIEDEDFVNGVILYMYDDSQQLLFNVLHRSLMQFEIAESRFNEELLKQLGTEDD